MWARRRRPLADPVTFVSALALLAALAHSAVDFDWSHPSVLAEAALLAALIVQPPRASRPTPSVPARTISVLAAVALLGLAVAAAQQWQQTQRVVPAVRRGDVPASAALHAAEAPFGDYRPALAVLERATSPDAVAPGDVRRALALTRRVAAVDAGVALERWRVDASYGTGGDVTGRVDALIASLSGDLAGLADPAARAYAAAGQRDRAVAVLAAALHREISNPGVPDVALWRHVEVWADVAGTSGDYGCAYEAVRASRGGPAVVQVPPPLPADHCINF